MKKKPILLVGVPRSGTSWTGDILSKARNAHFLYEPDNEKTQLVANWYKQNLHRFPFLPKEEVDKSYRALWDKIFSENTLKEYDSLPIKAGRVLLRNKLSKVEKQILRKSKSPPSKKTQKLNPIQEAWLLAMSHQLDPKEQLIVKSVHTGLSLNWIKERYQPKTVLLFRHPASIIASCLKLNMPDVNRFVHKQQPLTKKYLAPYMPKIKQLSNPLSFMGLQIAIHYHIWERLLEENKDWVSYTHESLCLDPHDKFKDLFDELSLKWTEDTEARITELNQNGDERDIRRKASDQLGKWKEVFSKEEIEWIKEGYSILPVKHYEGLSDGY